MLPPMYSTTGKKKGKQKFRSAEAASNARRNAENWQQLLEKYDVEQVVGKTNVGRKGNNKSVAYGRVDWRNHVDPNRLTDHIPSVNTGVGVAAKIENKQYTGDAMIGVSQMLKSNAVPVFRNTDILDIGKMRR